MIFLFDFVNIVLAPVLLLAFTTWLSGQYRQFMQRRHATLYFMLIGGGTILHELAHGLFALLFGMRITGFQLWSGQSSGQLGHVTFEYRKHSLWHGVGLMFVGLAPLLMLSLLTYGLLQAAAPGFCPYPLDATNPAAWQAWGKAWWQHIEHDPVTFVWFSLFSVLLPAVVPSRADLNLAARGAMAMLISLGGVVGIAWCLDGYDLLRGIAYTGQAWAMAIFGLNTVLALLVAGIAYLLSGIRCLFR